MNLLLASTLAVSGLILFTAIQEVGTHSSTKIRGRGRGIPQSRGNRGNLFSNRNTNSKSSFGEKVAAGGAVVDGIADVMTIAVSWLLFIYKFIALSLAY